MTGAEKEWSLHHHSGIDVSLETKCSLTKPSYLLFWTTGNKGGWAAVKQQWHLPVCVSSWDFQTSKITQYDARIKQGSDQDKP